MNRDRFFRALCLLLSVASLGGCATSAPSLSPQEQIKTDGYVVVRVVANATAIADMADKITVVYIGKPGATGKDPLYALKLQGRNMYTGWAPSGTYAVYAAVAASGIGSIYIGPDKSLTGSFMVVAGQVTDLQTLIYQPVGDQKSIFIPVAQSGDVRAAVSAAVPQVATQLLAVPAGTGALQASIPVQPDDDGRGASGQGLITDLILMVSDSSLAMQKQLRWTEAKSTDELLHMARQSTTKLNGGYFMDDGSVVFGSSLGQVLIRKSDGTWRVLDTGRLDDVNYVLVDRSTLVAGMDDGSVIFSSDDGAHWKEVPLSAPIGPIVKIFRRGDQDYLLVSHAGSWDDYSMDIYALKGLDHPDMSPVRHIKLGFDNIQLAHAPIAAFADFTQMSQGRMLIAEDDSHIDVYDPSAGTWGQVQTPGDFRRLESDSSGKFVTELGEHGSFSNSYRSADAGQHWVKVNTPSATVDVHFLTADSGLAWWAGIGTMSSSDAGKTWLRAPKLKEPCSGYEILDKSRQFLCVTQSAKIMSSVDGKTWVVERESY